MTEPQRGRIRGRVHAPGPCVVQIRWYDAEGRRLGRLRSYAGDWTLRLPAGRYFVEVIDERPESDPARFVTGMAAVVVRAGFVSEVEVRLTRDTRRSAARPVAVVPEPAGVLQGRVVDGAAPERGLAGAQVRLLDAHGALVGRTRCGADGRFAFEQLSSSHGLRLVVRPAPASHDHLRREVGGIEVRDGSWHDVGDVVLPVSDRPRPAPRLRSASVAFGSSRALTLPATRA
jgi:hypothetical protein